MSTNILPVYPIHPFNFDPADQQPPLFIHVINDLHKDMLRLMTGLVSRSYTDIIIKSEITCTCTSNAYNHFSSQQLHIVNCFT